MVRTSPHFSPGFVTRVAKGCEMLRFSRIGRRRRSSATLRSTIREKRDRLLSFAARSRHSVRCAGSHCPSGLSLELRIRRHHANPQGPFDNRSIRLNFEVAVVVYAEESTRVVEAMFEDGFGHWTMIDPLGFADKPRPSLA